MTKRKSPDELKPRGRKPATQDQAAPADDSAELTAAANDKAPPVPQAPADIPILSAEAVAAEVAANLAKMQGTPAAAPALDAPAPQDQAAAPADQVAPADDSAEDDGAADPFALAWKALVYAAVVQHFTEQTPVTTATSARQGVVFAERMTKQVQDAARRGQWGAKHAAVLQWTLAAAIRSKGISWATVELCLADVPRWVEAADDFLGDLANAAEGF